MQERWELDTTRNLVKFVDQFYTEIGQISADEDISQSLNQFISTRDIYKKTRREYIKLPDLSEFLEKHNLKDIGFETTQEVIDAYDSERKWKKL